jgi:hypothetical protein
MADNPNETNKETVGSSTELVSALNALLNATQNVTTTIQKKQQAEEEARITAEKNADEAEREAKARGDAREALQEYKSALREAKGDLKALGREVLNMARAGTKFAGEIGTSAVQGVQLDLKNRTALLSQIGRVEMNRMVNMEQLQAAERSLTDTFISTRAGYQLSAQGATNFGNALKGGFKSEFQLTGDSLRALTVIGATTETQMDAFRKATGRASLSSQQLSTIVNKNTLSFLLFGNKFAKAAADAERAGISLSSIQGAQEGMVGNLDNVIDTVAQLNQLGSGIDFGSLVQKLEQEGPDAVLQYLSSAIPGDLMQSTSFRALVNQLGIPAEQLLRQQKVGSAADEIESQMTQAGTEAGDAAKALTAVSRGADLLEGSFGKVAFAAMAAMTSLYGLAASSTAASLAQKSGLVSSLVSKMGTPAIGGLGTMARLGVSGAGLGIGIGSAMYGRSLVEQGNTKTGIGLGALGGGLGLALALAPFTGGASLLAAGAIGALAGGGYAAMGMNKGNDIFSGYGSRTLLTPSGAYALNNRDTVIAGTNLFRGDDVMSFAQGALGLVNPVAALGALLGNKLAGNDTKNNAMSGDLMKKIDTLITVLSSANTVINVDGSSEQVNRLKLTGVNVTRQSR